MTARNQLRLNKIIYTAGYVLLILLVLFLLNKVYYPANGDPNELNNAINTRNSEYARQNPFGFTDKKRSDKKQHGTYRIAVLGDSFIWGDGMPYEKVWSHKLETKLLMEYDSIEIMQWGKNGWSTLDEFNFFKEHGKDFDVDLLIIAWVDNDLDIGKIPPVHAIDPAKEMPVLNKICAPLAEAWIGHKEDRAYSAWMKKIYDKQNLEEYMNLLKNMGAYLDSLHLRGLYVMTPGPFDNNEEQHFSLMEPVLRNSGLPCVNLYPALYQKLHQYSNKELIANPVNGHPGEIMTEAIASEVEAYLKSKHYLPDSLKRR
jgi:hypothetical protein